MNNKRKNNIEENTYNTIPNVETIKHISCKPCDNQSVSLYQEVDNPEIVDILNNNKRIKNKRIKGGTLYNVNDFELEEKYSNRHSILSRDNKFGLLGRYYNEKYEEDIEELKKGLYSNNRLSRGMTIRECMNFMDKLSL